MSFAIEVKGLRELDEALSKLPDELQDKVLRMALRKAAEPVRAGAAERAPRGTTGELAENIVIAMKVPRPGLVIAKIGPAGTVFYGEFQELGTVHHAAQPFLRPALEEEGPGALLILARQLATGIERIASGLLKRVSGASS